MSQSDKDKSPEFTLNVNDGAKPRIIGETPAPEKPDTPAPAPQKGGK